MIYNYIIIYSDIENCEVQFDLCSLEGPTIFLFSPFSYNYPSRLYIYIHIFCVCVKFIAMLLSYRV